MSKPFVPKPLELEPPAERVMMAHDRSGGELDFWMRCVGAPLVLVDKATLRVRRTNASAAAFFGLEGDVHDHLPMEALVGPSAAQMLTQIWNNAPVGTPGEPFIIRATVQDQERLLVVQVTKLAVDGEQLRLFTFTDAPPQGSIALAGWQEDVMSMLNWLPFGFEIAGTDDQIQFANSTFKELFGYTQDEIASIEDWWRLCYPDPEYREHAKTTWYNSIEQARSENREMTPFDMAVMTASGEERRIQFRHRTIGNFNVNLYIDVTRERAYAEQLKRLANTDPLTGLLNRRCFFEEAERILARGERTAMEATKQGAIGLLMLDIDHFKAVNDNHGHRAGDFVLSEFARRCETVLVPENCFARLGGEEFALIIETSDLEKVTSLGEAIRRSIDSAPFAFEGSEIAISVSIGATVSLESSESFGSVVSRADKALYEAKRNGRNRVVSAST